MSDVETAPDARIHDRVAAVIPCYNAGSRVWPVVEGTLSHVQRVIVVDDGSTDGCVDALRPLPVTALRLVSNQGKGHALLTGIRAALRYSEVEAVVCLDADGQHDPSEIPRLVRRFFEDKADLLVGERVFDRAHVPWRSRFGNKVTAFVTARLLGRRLPDTQCGFRVLSRAFAEAALTRVVGGRYETEMEMIIMAVRDGYTVSFAPIETIYEPGNRSSHFKKVRDSLRIYWRIFQAAVLPGGSGPGSGQ